MINGYEVLGYPVARRSMEQVTLEIHLCNAPLTHKPTWLGGHGHAPGVVWQNPIAPPPPSGNNYRSVYDFFFITMTGLPKKAAERTHRD